MYIIVICTYAQIIPKREGARDLKLNIKHLTYYKYPRLNKLEYFNIIPKNLLLLRHCLIVNTYVNSA